MSRQIETMTGIVRSARNIPEGPRVSPTFVLMPNLFGMRTSCFHTLTSPERIVQIAASAPLRAALRFVVGTIFAGYFPSSTIRWIAFVIHFRRSLSMSMRASVDPSSAGNVSMSRTSPRVNPKLPAPMNAILGMTGTFLLSRCRCNASGPPRPPGQGSRPSRARSQALKRRRGRAKDERQRHDLETFVRCK